MNSHKTLPRPPTAALAEGTTHFSGRLKGGRRPSSSACTTGSTLTLGNCLGFCTTLTLLPSLGRWRQLLQTALTLMYTQLTSTHTETHSYMSRPISNCTVSKSILCKTIIKFFVVVQKLGFTTNYKQFTQQLGLYYCVTDYNRTPLSFLR